MDEALKWLENADRGASDKRSLSGFKAAKVVRDGSQPIEKVYSFFV
jgi:hypothetical protein